MADYEFITRTGVIVADTADLLEDVRSEYRQIFGEDLDTSPETPQGVLITAETLSRDAVMRNNAALGNQINPNVAGGVFLDHIWALTGGARVRATRSLVRGAVLGGRPGAVIPAGVQARTVAGDLFELTGAVVLNSEGTALGNFQSVEYGPIAAPTGQLNTLSTAVLGWETITNPTPAELGKTTESDQAARLRRRRTLALQGVALPEAIVSGLYAVEGVKSLTFRENVSNDPLTVDDVTLSPHSIYVCIDGGDDMAVAVALLRKKSIGAGWNGNVEVNVVEPYSGQTYLVKFARPVIRQIYAKVTIKAPETLSDPAKAVRDAIVSYAQGDIDGEPGFVVGGSVSGFELAAAVNMVDPSIFVKDVQIATDPDGPYGYATIPILISQKANIYSGAIQVNLL